MNLMSALSFSKVMWLGQFYLSRWDLLPSSENKNSNICQNYWYGVISWTLCYDPSAEGTLPTLKRIDLYTYYNSVLAGGPKALGFFLNQYITKHFKNMKAKYVKVRCIFPKLSKAP